MLPTTAPDVRAWAILWTRARKRKGWSYVRLSIEANVSEQTALMACTRGRCNGHTAYKLCRALGITLVLPHQHVYTGQEAQHGL